MPSIFQGNRIREHKATKYQGKPLVYGIGTNDPKACNLALQAHEFVYSLSLSEEQKRALNPKWMGQVVKALIRAGNKGQWREVLAQHLPALSPQLVYPAEQSRTAQAPIAEAPKTPIADLIKRYNHTQAHLHYGPYFPGAITSHETIKGLIDHLLAHGTLMQGNRSLTPIPEYACLIEKTPKGQIRNLRVKVADIQALIRHGRNWGAFCQLVGILDLTTFEPEHGKGYIAWRKGTRFHGEQGKTISTNILKKELGYFRSLCQFAVKKRLLTFNPMGDVKLSRMEARGKGNENHPLTYSEITQVLKQVGHKYTEAKRSPTLSHKRLLDIKWNSHLVLFLLCTGCRPSEAQNWEVIGNSIQFFKRGRNKVTGKTKNSSRKIPLTETLKAIVEDGTLLSQPCLSITSRLHQFLKRLNLVVTPYQFRHTTATLLFKLGELPNSEIAYRLGHATVDFSFRVYSDLDCFAEVPRENLKALWAWFNDGILNPCVPWFEIP